MVVGPFEQARNGRGKTGRVEIGLQTQGSGVLPRSGVGVCILRSPEEKYDSLFIAINGLLNSGIEDRRGGG